MKDENSDQSACDHLMNASDFSESAEDVSSSDDDDISLYSSRLHDSSSVDS